MGSGRGVVQKLVLRPKPKTQAGAALLYVIGALVLMAALAAAVPLLVTSTTSTSVANNRQARAYYLALSGLNAWTAGMTGTYTVGDATFTLAQSGPDASGYYTVTSQGTVNGGTPLEANAKLLGRRLGLSPISFAANLDDFNLPVVGKTENTASAVVVYAANASATLSGATSATRYASGWLRLGSGTKKTNGAIWYTGSRGTCSTTCPDGMCAKGKCTFAKGLRAYFGVYFSREDAKDDSTKYGDGFTFTVMNATGNDPASAAGGPSSGSFGEYLGYAGPGPGGLGIAAPKLAVEVDVYPNKGNNAATKVNSRRDASNANHIAVVYWGADGLYDDNVHGVGTVPVNPSGPTATNAGYYEKAKASGQPNWLEDVQEHTMRLEIQRADATDGGSYLVKVWIDGTGEAIDDVTKDYTGETPQIAYTATLAATDHEALDTIYFGWTEGTGDATQDVAIHDFSLEFRR